MKKNPTDWEIRKQLAHLLYDRGSFLEAADMVWEVDELPCIDVELAFAARVLAKALLHHGMVLQAARFYGAALEADPSLGNPDFEHFMLWTDDEDTLWGDFQNRRPKLGGLPWMKRDPREAMKLTSRVSHHTTPVKLPPVTPPPPARPKPPLPPLSQPRGRPSHALFRARFHTNSYLRTRLSNNGRHVGQS